MRSLFIGIDTSCYTTSAACVDEKGIVLDRRTMLLVEQGERGLRQSDGVFQHVRNLGTLLPSLLDALPLEQIASVGVSMRPRPDRDSYMPVFLAGKTCAATLASGLGVPLHECSHQEGHIRAVLVGNEGLRAKPFLSMHLSGGTTEVVSVDEDMNIMLLGGTNDLHAGQFVDRVGVSMGLAFPCGQELEKRAAAFHGTPAYKLPSSVRGCACSFSGVESEAQRKLTAGADHNELAFALYDCLARTFCSMLECAAQKTGYDTALLAGGVASSPLLRMFMHERMNKHGNIKLIFGESTLSSDNAVGVAYLAMDAFGRKA